jgi:hypothetical protein
VQATIIRHLVTTTGMGGKRQTSGADQRIREKDNKLNATPWDSRVVDSQHPQDQSIAPRGQSKFDLDGHWSLACGYPEWASFVRLSPDYR